MHKGNYDPKHGGPRSWALCPYCHKAKKGVRRLDKHVSEKHRG